LLLFLQECGWHGSPYAAEGTQLVDEIVATKPGMHFFRQLTVLFCAGLLSATPLVAAGDRGVLDDRLTLSLGTFLMSTNTTLALNGSAGAVGTEVDLERDLGLHSGDRFRVDANWRISGGHHARALYFDYGSSRTRTLEREIQVGDTTYPVNVSVEAGLGATIYALAYEYAFLQHEKWELLGSVGAHIAKFSFNIRGDGTIDGQPANARSEAASTTAPLPVVGVRYAWQFAPDWYFGAQAQYFALSVDNVDGRVIDLSASVHWMFTEHFGVGAGWNRFNTDVDISRNRFNGSLDWTYSGAKIFVTASF